jgi:hypothetical protein
MREVWNDSIVRLSDNNNVATGFVFCNTAFEM